MKILAGVVLGLSLAFIALAILIGRRFDRQEKEILRRVDENQDEPPKLGHLTGSPRVAIVVDGPLEGMIHEIYGSFRPDVIAFPPPGDGTSPTRHFYRLDADGGLRFLRTEPRASV